MPGIILAAALCLHNAASDPSAAYTVTIPADKTAAHVEASFNLTRPFLQIDEGAYSKGVEGGLAGFIENLCVTLPNGSEAKIDNTVGGRWRIDAPENSRVTVQYEVRLDHAEKRWPFGLDEIAYRSDNTVFFIGRTVLLLTPGLGQSRVRFAVPDSFRIATPWTPVDGELNTFDVASIDELAESCILIGDFLEREVRVGDAVIALAVGRALDPYVDALEASLQACIPAYSELFQDAPQSRFLAVVDVNPSPGLINGSAYPSSICMLTPKRLEGAVYTSAIHTMAHEVLHLWNGKAMRPAGQTEWFKEGFTDYMTWRTLIEQQLIDEKTFLLELQRQCNAYRNLERTVSIGAAGASKAQNSTLVYEGGSLVAFCLDATIRTQTNHESTISDFMRAIYARSALKDSPYNETMIAETATEIAGIDCQPFFDRFVKGMDPLPIDESLAAFGLHAEQNNVGNRTNLTIIPNKSAQGPAATARDAFLGRNR